MTAVLSLQMLAAGASGVAVQVVDGGGTPLPDVAVYVEAEPGQSLPKYLKPGEIEQRGQKFIPLMTVVQVGSRINFPNNDKVRHHIYSFSPAHKFDQKLYSGTAATPQVFEKAGVVVLGCNIHDKMVAYIRVVDTPFYGKTDGSGAVRIEMPTPGKYILKVWHYNMVGGQPAEQVLTVKPGEAPTTATFKLALKPPSADADASSGSSL
ncbi:MAG: methylamine utilization protein [Pseudomonadota bacterium]